MSPLKNKQHEQIGLTQEITITRCYGCGAILQSDNPLEPGYLPKDKMKGDDKLCQACYRLRHYGEVKENSPSFDDNYVKLLTRANEEKSLIVYVIDSFFIEASLIKDLHKYLTGNVLVVLNKKDILPPKFPEDKLMGKIKAILTQDNVKILDMMYISSVSGYNMDLLMNKINQLRKGKNIYFIGASNVGKSSIVNKILKNFKNKTDKLITTSRFPGTTLGVIGIPLDNNSYMFDTPGVFNPNSCLSQLDKKALKYIIPRKQIKTTIYQKVKDNTAFIFGGVARFDVISTNKNTTNLTIFMSNEVEITKANVNKADNTFVSLICQKVNPSVQSIKEIRDLEKHEYKLPDTKEGTINITIVGFGSIMMDGRGQTIAVYAPRNVAVRIEHINYRA